MQCKFNCSDECGMCRSAGRFKKLKSQTKDTPGWYPSINPTTPPPSDTRPVWATCSSPCFKRFPVGMMWKQTGGRPKTTKLCAGFYLTCSQDTEVCDRATHPRVYFGNPLSGSSLFWVGRNGTNQSCPVPRWRLASYRIADASKQGKVGRRPTSWMGPNQASRRLLVADAVETTDSVESSVPKTNEKQVLVLQELSVRLTRLTRLIIESRVSRVESYADWRTGLVIRRATLDQRT